MRDKIREFIKNPSSRIIALFIVILVLFFCLVLKLFKLQIVEGSYYANNFNERTIKTIEVVAPRGSIFDKNGIPLATNVSSYSIKLDPSINVDNINSIILKTINLLERNNDEYIDNFPIEIINGDMVFTNSDAQEKRWKKDMDFVDKYGKASDISANEVFTKLRETFDIPKNLSNEVARKILNIRTEKYKQRYSSYLPITIAYNVSQESVIEIEENDDVYTSMYVEKAMERVYPYGKYISHLIGYVGNITKKELDKFEENGIDNYGQNDIVGKTKLEKSLESYLRGEPGKKSIEVTYTGKRQDVLEIEPPKSANSAFLTIDINLQKEIYDLVEKRLTDIIIGKLSTNKSTEAITTKRALKSLVNANNLPIKNLYEQPEGTVSFSVKQRILEIDENANVDNYENKRHTQSILVDLIENDNVSTSEIMLMLIENNIISGTDENIRNLKLGRNVRSMLIKKLESNEITPEMLMIDPYSASIVVADVNTGDVLAAVSYPSYDNNQLVNNINNEYYSKILVDPSQPMMNRTFSDAKAPGSTLKMLTAIAGLEENVISPTTTVYDGTVFEKAGVPYAKCWSLSNSHGRVDASGALEVSCNYFFYDLSYTLGNASDGSTYDGIAKLNKYMEDFGLNARTGVEIGEHADVYPSEQKIISSPEYKEFNVKLWYDEPSSSQLKWYDGDTIRTAIGQSENYYTAASMAKYTVALANRGTRYQFHLVNEIKDSYGNIVDSVEPVIEKQLEYSTTTWDEVYSGMYKVTHGNRGTARSVYSNYPIVVAGKTGTVQGSSTRKNHSTFTSFAPMDKPEIAVYTIFPNGDTSVYASAASKTTKDVYDIYFDLNQEDNMEYTNDDGLNELEDLKSHLTK
ncbi:MAG: penicillin-binding transpeptidase domain-containing protein [Lachnospirales bacterium]